MYIWTVTLDEQWDQEEDFPYGCDAEYTVSAQTYEQALSKAEKCAKKKKFIDNEDAEGDGKTHRVIKTRLVSIKRGAQLDA